jgi:uncharacterized membrane protein YdbT with pleckstrin-like domain
MANSYLESTLSEHERIVHSARQHWFLLAGSIFMEILFILIILAVTVTAAIMLPGFHFLVALIGFVIILIPIATMTRDILSWSNQQFIVSNRRVIHLSGILDKMVTDSSLEKVNDVRMTQSALGRIFDYGDIEILTASELGVNSFRWIENPVKFKTAMLNAKEQLEAGDSKAQGEFPAEEKQDFIALLSQLDQLRQQGILTQAEFEQKKAQILARM